MAYEYALVDKDGRLREDFDRRSDAIDELVRIERKHPGTTTSWMLLTYDDAGQVGEPEWGDELLMATADRASAMALPRFNTRREHLSVARVEYKFIGRLDHGAGWCGTRASIAPAFSRRCGDARRTHSQAQGEVAAR